VGEGVAAGDVERSWSGLGANERGFRLPEVAAAPGVLIVAVKGRQMKPHAA
jgi:hypothetical protein